MNNPSSTPTIMPAESARVPSGNIQTLVLIIATALGIYLCFRLVAPFIAALAFAMALAVLFTPLQKRLEGKLKRASLAAAVTTLAIGTSWWCH